MVEAYAFEVLEEGRDEESHQSCRQEGCILEVKVMRVIFLYEWPKVGDIDLL